MKRRLRAFRSFEKFRVRLLADPKVKADNSLLQQVRVLTQLDTQPACRGPWQPY